MAERAAKLGEKISVIATVPATLEPSCLLVEEAARSAGKEVFVKRCFVEGAYDALLTEGKQRHNEMIIDRVRAEAAESDVVVLAQGSMVCLIPLLADIKTPVLTSPRMGIERVREALGLKA